MQNIDFNDVLLYMYYAKSDEGLEEVLSKNLMSVLNAVESGDKQKSDEAIKTINEILVFIKPKLSIRVPLKDIVIFYLKSKNPLAKNIATIFIKLGLERTPPGQNYQIAKTLMMTFQSLPQNLQIITYKSFLAAYEFIAPQQYIDILSKNIVLLRASIKTSSQTLQYFPQYVTTNVKQFKGYEELFATLVHSFDISINIPEDFNFGIITNYFMNCAKSSDSLLAARALKLLTQIPHKLPLEFLNNNLNLTDGILLLDSQIELYETMQPLTKQFAEILITKLQTPAASRCLRNLLKTYHKEFQNDYVLFKQIFDCDADSETVTSLMILFSTFINPSVVEKFIEKNLEDGNSSLALRLMRFIFPYKNPRPKLFACALANDVSMIDESRLLLFPYKHVVNDGFRAVIYDSSSQPPTTGELFNELMNMPNLKRYLSNPNSTRAIDSFFQFCCRCNVTLPLPFSFIIQEFSNCPSAAPGISKFLGYVSQKIEFEGEFSQQDIDQCINVMKEESDPEIVEAVSGFLCWTKAKIDVESVSSQLKNPKKIAFLAHYGCPFDECLELLNSVSNASLGKHCLMAMAKRGLLNKEHFDKLFSKFSIDSYGIEVLSVIAKGDVELCRRIVNCLFEPPLISTERVEVIVAGAKKLVEIIDDEEFLMKKIDDGLRKDRSRRNSAIFLLYMINNKVPERLWFATRSLLFCSGADNGVVRTAGIMGLPILYDKCNDEQKKIFDDAIHGRNKPENSDVHAQVPSGQPRAQTIMTCFHLSQYKSLLFMQILTALIESEFLIFTDIEVPRETITAEDKDRLSAFFYCESFSPTEDRGSAFRKLYKWATDGGKKLQVDAVIKAIDSEAEGWEQQQANIACLKDIISRMTTEQAQEYFGMLSKTALRIAYSPNNELKIAGADVLDKAVTKIGNNAPESTLKALLDLINEVFDSHQPALVLLGAKWCSQLSQQIKTGADALVVFDALFHAISSSASFGTPTQMLASDAWNVLTRVIFKCTELSLSKFFDRILEYLAGSYALESVRYTIFYCLDACVRAQDKLTIAEKLETMLERLFFLASEEKAENVIPIVVSALQHSISTICQAHDDFFDYDHFLIDLYFEKERQDLAALIIKAICQNNPEHLRSSLTPFILLASCGENYAADFAKVIKEELTLKIEVTSRPDVFSKFLMERGLNGNNAMKSAGAKALKKCFMVMKPETLKSMAKVVDEIAATLDSRLYPGKEELIDCIKLAVPYLDEIPQKLIDLILKQCSRQKSVFRAAAANCIVAMKKRGIAIDENKFGEQLVAMAKDGTGVALETAADCAEGEWVQKVADIVYSRVDKADAELLPNLICAIQNLKEHKAPDNFNMEELEAKLV